VDSSSFAKSRGRSGSPSSPGERSRANTGESAPEETPEPVPEPVPPPPVAEPKPKPKPKPKPVAKTSAPPAPAKPVPAPAVPLVPAGPKPARLPDPAKWVKVYDTPESVTPYQGVAKWSATGIELKGGLMIPQVTATDVALRAKVHGSKGGVSLIVRSGAGPVTRQLAYAPELHTMTIIRRKNDEYIHLASYDTSKILRSPQDPVELEFVAVGKVLQASLNGKVIGSVLDSEEPVAGTLSLYADGIAVSDIAWQPLDEFTAKLAALEREFQERLKREADAPFEAALGELGAKLKAALERSLPALRGSSAETVLRADLARIDRREPIPPATEPGLAPVTANFRKTWHAELEKLLATRAQNILPAKTAYDEALAALQKECADQGDQTRAQRVQAARTALASSALNVALKSASTPDEVARKLASLEEGFQAAFQRDAGQAHAAAVTDLNTGYTGAVHRALDAVSQEGELEEAVILREEIVRMTDGRGLPPVDLDNLPASLKQLRLTYRAQLAKLEAVRDQKAAPLYDRYDQALAAYQADLTTRKKLDDALRVKAARDEISKRRGVIPTTVATAGSAPKSKTKKPSEASLPAIKEDPASVRRAAEWVIGLGGNITVDGLPGAVSSVEGLPKGRFTVTRVSMQNSQKSPEPIDLMQLAPFTELDTIDMHSFQSKLESWMVVSRMKALTSIATSSPLSDQVWRKGGLEYLPPQLTTLRIYGTFTTFAGHGLSKVACKDLNHAAFMGTSFDDQGLAELAASRSSRSCF